MSYRDIKIIKQEISEVTNLMAPLKKYLINHPEDFGVKLDLDSFRGRHEELLRELGYAKNNFGVTSFDFHISCNDNKKIDITQLGHICLSFQDLIHSCAMVDDKNPVKKGTSINQEILNSTCVQVEAVETGSLNLLVSPKDNQSTFSKSYLKQSLEQIGKIIDCGNNKDKITSLVGEIGSQPIYKYKKLLNDLKNDNLNLDICYSVKPEGVSTKSLKAHVAREIYDLINDVGEEEIDTINVTGILYSVNLKNNTCGIEVTSRNLEKNNVTIIFRDSFKTQLKEKLDNEISVSLERTVQFNAVEEDSKTIFNLLNIN